MNYEHVSHTFGPVFNQESKILILGSFPSVKSREQNFYYGHPQNRFWKVMAMIFCCKCPEGVKEKKQFLLKHQIALWDVIESCDISGSSDSSIRNVTANDMNVITEKAPIQMILLNGEKAYTLFQKYCTVSDGITIQKMPSTSPANAAFSLEKLADIWSGSIKG